MGRIKDLNSALPSETDNLVFDGLNGTRRISYADFKQKLQDDGFGSGSSEAVVLTQAEYDALPDEVKDSDTIFFISDAPFENSNVVTLTRAQYDALSDATKMDGRFYYITDEEEVAKSLVVQTNVNSTETVPSSAVVYGLNKDITDTLDGLKSQGVINMSEFPNYQSGVGRWARVGNLVLFSFSNVRFIDQAASTTIHHSASLTALGMPTGIILEWDFHGGNGNTQFSEVFVNGNAIDFRTYATGSIWLSGFYALAEA